MRKFRLLSLLLLAITFIVINCTKEGPEGPVGATGPQGPAGTNGANGTNGTNGTNGAAGTTGPQGIQGVPGTANVIYSSWLLTGVGNWTTTGTTPYYANYLYDRAATGVTQSIMDQGVVLSYMKGLFALGAGEVVGLPYTRYSQGGINYIDQYSFILNAPGNIRYLYTSGNNLTPIAISNIEPISTRYIIIPGGVSGGRGIDVQMTSTGYTVDELKTMSYHQVCTLLKISE